MSTYTIVVSDYTHGERQFFGIYKDLATAKSYRENIRDFLARMTRYGLNARIEVEIFQND